MTKQSAFEASDEKVGEMMEYLCARFDPVGPSYIIILKDTEVDGMVLLAGTYIDGVRQDALASKPQRGE